MQPVLAFKSLMIAVVGGGIALCPLCLTGPSPMTLAAATDPVRQSADTSTARLRISGMDCATCPVTARTALRKIPGVFAARVTYDDSLGVVRYDARRVSAKRIAEELERRTGYRATVLPDSGASVRKDGGL
jgi:mercuric ion binding protein